MRTIIGRENELTSITLEAINGVERGLLTEMFRSNMSNGNNLNRLKVTKKRRKDDGQVTQVTLAYPTAINAKTLEEAGFHEMSDWGGGRKPNNWYNWRRHAIYPSWVIKWFGSEVKGYAILYNNVDRVYNDPYENDPNIVNLSQVYVEKTGKHLNIQKRVVHSIGEIQEIMEREI